VFGEKKWRILLQKEKAHNAYENDALNALLARESKRAEEEEEEEAEDG
jgi:hypothetical protein